MADELEVHFFGAQPHAFVVVPQSACPSWSQAGTDEAARATGTCTMIEVGGAPSLVLLGRAAVACFLDGPCAYFIRWTKWKDGDHDAKMKRLIASVKDAQWKAQGTFEVVSEPLMLFSSAKSPYKWGRWEMPGNFAGGAAVVALAKGTYDVHVAEKVTGERTAVDLVRLTPAGKKATAPKTEAFDAARASLEREAAKVKWIDSEGGPFVALPAGLKKAWRGAKDYDSGTSDYERACEIERKGGVLIEIDGGHAVVVPGPESATAMEVGGDWLFVTQHRADDPVDAYAAMRAVPDKSFGKKATLEIPTGGLELRDASIIGRAPSLKVAVAAGKYEVARAVVKKPGMFLSVVRLRKTR